MFSKIAVYAHDHVDKFAFGHIAFSQKPTDISRDLKMSTVKTFTVKKKKQKCSQRFICKDIHQKLATIQKEKKLKTTFNIKGMSQHEGEQPGIGRNTISFSYWILKIHTCQYSYLE